MTDTDYVIRQVTKAGRGRVCVTVVDMVGRVRNLTMNADMFNVGEWDRLIRAVLANDRNVRTPHRKAANGGNV